MPGATVELAIVGAVLAATLPQRFLTDSYSVRLTICLSVCLSLCCRLHSVSRDPLAHFRWCSVCGDLRRCILVSI